MVCLTADGDVTVLALMEAILFWQSNGDLFVWEDTDGQEDREMTQWSTLSKINLAALEGFKNDMSRKVFVSVSTRVSYNVIKNVTDSALTSDI